MNINKKIIAVDIGGTNIRVGITNPDGKILKKISFENDGNKDISIATEKILFKILNIKENNNILGIGISSAGPIDPNTGIYNHSPNLSSWHGKSMKKALEQATNLPVFFGHDATLAALAEVTYGEFKNSENLIYITISTGIGGGIIANNKMITGEKGSIELGHMIVNPGGEKCNIGCVGCLEGCASGPAIVNITKKLYDKYSDEDALKKTTKFDKKNLTTKIIFDAEKMGSDLSKKIVQDTIKHISTGIINLLNIFDPEVIILGGGVINSLSSYWTELQSKSNKGALPGHRKTPIEITSLGEDVCLLGASVLVNKKIT